MDETSMPRMQTENLDRSYKKKRVEEIGSTLAQIRARHKASRSSCPKKEDEPLASLPKAPQEKLNEKNELYMLLEEDRAKAEKLVKERPKIKEALENLKIDREQQKMVEKKIEETRAKQAAPLPEIPPEIQKRIFEMEMTIHNLRENLGEKDKVLSSKTESLKMLNEQLSQRSSEFMERTEAMRLEIDSLKEEYNRQEELLKTELSKTKSLLEETQSRLTEKEAECNSNASIVEEFSALKSSHSQNESELQSLKQTLDNANKQSLKLMAQLKSIKIERDKLKKEKPDLDGIETLQNKIALLEEEKELAAASQKKIDELEDALRNSNELLQKIQQEKDSAFEKLEAAGATILDQSAMIREMGDALDEMKRVKITAEMKAVELEEKLESENFEENRLRADKLEKELSNLKEYLTQQEELINALNIRLVAREKEIESQIASQNIDSIDSEKVMEEVMQWKSKLLETEGKLDGVSRYNEELLEELKRLKENSDSKTNESEKLNNELKQKDDLIQTYEMKIDQLHSLVDTKSQHITSLEQEISKIKNTKETGKSGQPEQTDLSQKYVKLVANFKMKAKLCQELKENIEVLSKKLSEKEEADNILKDKNQLLEAKVNDLDREMANYKEMSGIKDDKLRELEQFVESIKVSIVCDESPEMARNHEDILLHLKELRDKSAYLSEREQELFSLKSDYESLKGDFSKLQAEYENLLLTFQEKERVINEIDMERDHLRKELTSYHTQLGKLQRVFEGESSKTEEVCQKYREEIDHLLEQLSEITSKFEQSQLQLHEKEVYIENLEQGVESLKMKMQDILYKFEENKKGMKEKAHLLETRLQEAELSNEKFEKHHLEMENKISEYEEKQKNLENKLSESRTQIEELTLINLNLQEKNDELEQTKDSFYTKVNEMELELSTLKNVKDAYNYTLDQIEILNEDLKQVRAQIESRDQELLAVNEQRKILSDKLTDMDESFTDFHRKLKETETHNESLKTELEMKGKHLEQANQEILSLQAQLSMTQNMESQNFAREMEISQIKMIYEDKIQSLQQEKEDLIGVLKTQVAGEVSNVMSMAEDRLAQMESNPREEQGVGVFKWNNRSSAHRDMSFDEAKDDEDGWGWIAPEVKNEQEPKNADAMKVQELLRKIQELEEEKARISEELQATQVKCNKLKKIVKDVKAQNDLLKKAKQERSSGMDDFLNLALQEELRSQVDKAEQDNKDLTSELSTLKLEKERLLKRVDTLTSANDELIEMKERQDFEVEMWKKRSTELKNQVQGLEWNLEELRASGNAGVDNELEEKFAALVSENEELQRIICDLKDCKQQQTIDQRLQQSTSECKNAESNKESEIKKDFENIMKELEYSRQQYKVLLETYENQELKLSEITTTKDTLEAALSSAEEELIPLRERHNLLTEDLAKMEFLVKERDELKTRADRSMSENEALVESVQNLKTANEKISGTLEKLKIENSELKSLLGSMEEKLKLETVPDKSQIESLKKENDELKQELTALKEKDIPKKSANLETSLNVAFGATPPVFRGFATSGNDPFSEVVESDNKLRESNNSLKEELKEKAELLSKTKEELKKLKDFALALETERDAFVMDREDLLRQFQNKDEYIFSLQAELTRLSGELESAKSNLLSHSTKHDLAFEQKEKVITMLKDSLNLLKQEKNQVKNDLNNLTLYVSSALKQIALVGNDVGAQYENYIKLREDNYQQVLLNKEEENAHLICDISSRQQQFSALLDETENLKKEIVQLNDKVEYFKVERSTLDSTLESYWDENKQLKSNRDSELSSLTAQVDYLTQCMSQKDSENERLSQKIEEQNSLMCELQQRLLDSGNSIDILETSSSNLKKELEGKEIEIENLKLTLTSLENEKALLEGENVKARDLIADRERRIQSLEEAESTERAMQAVEVTRILEDKDVEVARLSALLRESQERLASVKATEEVDGEGVSQAEEVARMLEEKDSEIARLSGLLTESQERLIAAETSKPGGEVTGLRGRLDEALYTLHLRDVRCEELTLEIMQLLEERDTLQLRLSESLRLNERLRKVPGGGGEQLEPPPGLPAQSQGVPVQSPPSLNEKIGELHSGYRKDPVVQQERENRHSQQMQLYTQKNA